MRTPYAGRLSDKRPQSLFTEEKDAAIHFIFDCLDVPDLAMQAVIREAHSLLLRENRDDALILKKVYQNDQQLVLTMLILEPDKSFAEFCGNGARVVACYLKQKFEDMNLEFYLHTSRGKRRIWWDDNGFHVEMGKTYLGTCESKFIQKNFEEFPLGLGMRRFTFYWTETLEPHLVTFDGILDQELYDLGMYLNRHQRDFFPLGVNLNRAEILGDSDVRVTTFERGVNRITAACGTGATSCAMLGMASGRLKNNECIRVHLKGGTITIRPMDDGGAVMSGPGVN